MDAQPAQQPTSTTYARAQQPADSPAAALLTETLIRVFELALEEEEDPFERQKLRWRFQKVSWQWSTAVGEQREYAVTTDKEAQALKRAISMTGRSDEVQSLALTTSNLDLAPWKEELLQLCSAVNKLELSLLPPSDLALPGNVTRRAPEVLACSKGVRKFVLNDRRGYTAHHLFDLSGFLNSWPSLKSLEVKIAVHQGFTWARAAPSSLQHLEIPASDLLLVRVLLPHLRDPTLFRSLRIRIDPDYPSTPHESLAEELLPLANRLHRFSALGGWEPSTEFEQLIGAMSSLQHLELGYTTSNALPADETKHNLPPSASLGQLASLRELILRDVGKAQTTTYLLATLNDLLSTPPASLKRIQLDSSLTTSWPEGARAELESKAEAAGVWLVFVV
ncbi:hypothetical protein BCR35DRAFT_352240 [Leucosporidium creatinivorum]|uniref:Proteophosphoglycan ppg4 n=1 Tax=Leucosporidium creatinivorum TaxID=106004 RepID=A0A1Y2FER9_9BASI|nr:hypothetical protein BCR35DRAFT_352240 [Leucosporidium creatinivorum]